jgi:hypothetical protein
MTDLVPVTSWSRNRKHLARPEDLRPHHFTGGRSGRSLCDSQTHADVYDQDWLDAKRLEWFGKPAGSQLIVNMRPCKRCEKAAART